MCSYPTAAQAKHKLLKHRACLLEINRQSSLEIDQQSRMAMSEQTKEEPGYAEAPP